ncbi:MAG: phenylacetate-CoA oxygenase/reductase subunit PaaK [Chitinophagaceae bacterium]|nr:phenylacetate-CoA oxygenase/reductase subunit PaaK [Chitinophagaceae bacterium]
MSIHFHRLPVKEIKKETVDCVSVVFEVPAALQKEFQYNQGQSLTMRATINGEEVRRTYSICSSPLDNKLRVAIKKVEGGLFSQFANDTLKQGDVLDVMQPIGKFYTDLSPSQQKSYVAFAAGSGITPVLSLIKTTLATEPHSSFTLVYGNKNRGSVIFFEELEGLKNLYMQRFTLIHVLSREKTDTPLNFGRIDTPKLDDLGKFLDYASTNEFFICGPEEMIFCVKDYLENKGIDKKKIHFELFTSPGQARSKIKNQNPETEDTGAKSNITVNLDGRSFSFDLPFASDISVLDAALKQGADLPYACKGGMCCTCKAKLVEGEVMMDVHWGLEEEEVEKGFILTCQSHPKTEKITVDFDIK